MKTCIKCLKIKELSSFYMNRKTRVPSDKCKSCTSSYIRDFVDTNAPWDEVRDAAYRAHISKINSKVRGSYNADKRRKKRAEKRKLLIAECEEQLNLEKQLRVIEWARRKDEQTNQQAEEGNA